MQSLKLILFFHKLLGSYYIFFSVTQLYMSCRDQKLIVYCNIVQVKFDIRPL